MLSDEKKISIVVNGKREEVDSEITLQRLLDQKGINPNVVACEVNLSIVRRAKLSEHVLKNGDEVEIIQMIGGG